MLDRFEHNFGGCRLLRPNALDPIRESRRTTCHTLRRESQPPLRRQINPRPTTAFCKPCYVNGSSKIPGRNLPCQNYCVETLACLSVGPRVGNAKVAVDACDDNCGDRALSIIGVIPVRAGALPCRHAPPLFWLSNSVGRQRTSDFTTILAKRFQGSDSSADLPGKTWRL